MVTFIGEVKGHIQSWRTKDSSSIDWPVLWGASMNNQCISPFHLISVAYMVGALKFQTQVAWQIGQENSSAGPDHLS